MTFIVIGTLRVRYKNCVLAQMIYFSLVYILQLITSRVSLHGHMMVELDFFETVVRYDKFFTCEPQHIPDVLVSNTEQTSRKECVIDFF